MPLRNIDRTRWASAPEASAVRRGRNAPEKLPLPTGHAHDLLNDLDRETVIADIRDWLLARIPAK